MSKPTNSNIKDIKESAGSMAKNIIGVFDSGLGGLSVLKSLLKDLPEYNYIYLGDNAHLPYGEKSPEAIYEYSRIAVDYLFKSGCNLVIIACNTASSQALRRLQQEYLPANYPKRRILGVVRPLVEAAAQKKNQRVGVIGTKATVESKAYQTELEKLRPDLKVYQISAPLLVPLIEEGWANKPETKMILKKYLKPLKTKQIDSLILACTHYPLIHKQFEKIMGRRISVPQPGKIIAQSLKDYLDRHPELGLEAAKKPQREFYVTDSPDKFKLWGEKFLERNMDKLQLIKLPQS